MLLKIKLLLGINDTSKDQLLLVLIEKAIEEVNLFCHRDDICGLENTICDMVVYKFNRLDTEGVDSESYSGVNYTYSSDYPEDILRALKAHRKVRTID